MFKFPEKIRPGAFPQPEFPHDPDPDKRRMAQRLWTWSVAAVFCTAVVLNIDALMELMVEISSAAFDFVEQTLEGFFRKTAKMDIRHAQMATAYTYFTLAVLAFLLLGRRVSRWLTRNCQTVARHYRTGAQHWHTTFHEYSIYLHAWWQSLDWLNRIAVLVAAFLGAVPLFLLLSFGLGVAVAELL